MENKADEQKRPKETTLHCDMCLVYLNLNHLDACLKECFFRSVRLAVLFVYR